MFKKKCNFLCDLKLHEGMWRKATLMWKGSCRSPAPCFVFPLSYWIECLLVFRLKQTETKNDKCLTKATGGGRAT